MSTGVRFGRVLAMAVDQGPAATVYRDPPYRHLRPGHFVIVGADTDASTSWWMGQIICCEGSDASRGRDANCQVTDVESGLQRRIHAGEVTEVVWALDGWFDSQTSL